MTASEPTAAGVSDGGWSREAIRDLLVREVAERGRPLGLTPADIDGGFDVLGSGAVDSLGFVELLMGIEQALGRPIALESLEFERLDSLDAVAEQLHRLQRPNGADGRG